MTTLYLVRHAAVDPRVEVAARDWPLSAEGEDAARELAGSEAWRSLAAIVSSPEPKAIATAQPIADAAKRALQIDPDLREVDRGATALRAAAAYHALVAAYFAGQDIGWERDAAARITSCIERLVAAVDGSLCVVSHGLVLSHFVAHLRGGPPDLDAWRAMPQPAIAVVDARAWQVVAPFGSLHSWLSRPTSAGSSS